MGGSFSCPSGFEERSFFACSAVCPAEFKKLRGQQEDECVHIIRNNRRFRLRNVPKQRDIDRENSVEPPLYERERIRVRNEAAEVRRQVEEDIERAREVNAASDSRNQHIQQFSNIQSQAAVFTSMKGAAQEVRDVTNSLRRFRPPTAPSSDLEIQRKAIIDISNRNLYFVQIALACVILALVGYLILPIGYAHGIAFLILCVAIAVGFFLRKE